MTGNVNKKVGEKAIDIVSSEWQLCRNIIDRLGDPVTPTTQPGQSLLGLHLTFHYEDIPKLVELTEFIAVFLLRVVIVCYSDN